MFLKSILFSFLIFGPKIGFLDTSIIIPLLLINFLKNIKVNKSIFLYIYYVIFLVVIQILSFLINQNFDFEVIGRLIRVILVIFILSIVVEKSYIINVEIIYVIFYLILIHSIFIILCSLYKPLNEISILISGIEYIRPYRSAGVLSGFDIAGLISIVGIILLGFEIVRINNKFIEISSVIIILASTYFTSRVTILFALVVLIKYVSIILKYRLNFIQKFIYILIFLLTLIYFTYEAYIIFEVTLNLGLMDISNDQAESILQRSAAVSGDADILWTHMFFLPENTSGFILGEGVNQTLSDVGYVNEIYRYGLIGLFMSIFIHLLIGLKNIRLNSDNIKYLRFILVIIVLLFSLKNNYFFVRSFGVIFLTLSFIFINEKKYYEK